MRSNDAGPNATRAYSVKPAIAKAMPFGQSMPSGWTRRARRPTILLSITETRRLMAVELIRYATLPASPWRDGAARKADIGDALRLMHGAAIDRLAKTSAALIHFSPH